MSLAWIEGREPRREPPTAVDIRCDDCGRSKRMPPSEVARHLGQGRSLIALHNRLYCALCRERGGLGKNISLIPVVPRRR